MRGMTDPFLAGADTRGLGPDLRSNSISRQIYINISEGSFSFQLSMRWLSNWIKLYIVTYVCTLLQSNGFEKKREKCDYILLYNQSSDNNDEMWDLRWDVFDVHTWGRKKCYGFSTQFGTKNININIFVVKARIFVL